MADKKIYTIEERLIVVCGFMKKNELGETYEEIRGNFFLRFNKAASRKANLQEAPISKCATTGCGPT